MVPTLGLDRGTLKIPRAQFICFPFNPLTLKHRPSKPIFPKFGIHDRKHVLTTNSKFRSDWMITSTFFWPISYDAAGRFRVFPPRRPRPAPTLPLPWRRPADRLQIGVRLPSVLRLCPVDICAAHMMLLAVKQLPGLLFIEKCRCPNTTFILVICHKRTARNWRDLFCHNIHT